MRSADGRPTEAADVAVCLSLLRSGSRSFYAASLLLPRRLRHEAAAIYAFCRVADDAADLGPLTSATIAALVDRLDRVFTDTALDSPIDRALARVVARHALPRRPFDLLLEGFQWELEGRQYRTIDDVRSYAVRVAGSVGALMTHLMGRRDTGALSRAVDLGVAMQLTNIARDVGEDARNGRLYLPRMWLMEAGVEPEAWLAAPRFHPGVGEVVRRLLDEADRLYRRAERGLRDLPWRARPAIRAARLIYADIGRALRVREYDSVSRRAATGPWRKAQLLLRALLPLRDERLRTRSVLTEGAALVAAVADAASVVPAAATAARRTRPL